MAGATRKCTFLALYWKIEDAIAKQEQSEGWVLKQSANGYKMGGHEILQGPLAKLSDTFE